MVDVERLSRNRQKASLKRDAAASQIESIYNLGLSASSDTSIIPKFLLAIKDIDEYWVKFTVENDSMLETMIELGTEQEFVINVEIEVRNTVLSAKALANQLRISSGASEVSSEVGQNDKPSLLDSVPNAESVTNPSAQLGPVIAQLAPSESRIRLPEIPLPTFDGRLQNWPDFRDRFSTLVDQKAHLTNIEKFYYLLGCLQAGPTDVVKGITVSDATYNLAWSALVNRYEKPRQLATTLVNNMLNATVQHQESPNALINFLNEFCENIAMLKSLSIPDLGSFLLFAISVRCLPASSRRLFEQDNSLEFPTVDSLLLFIKERLEVLENAGTSMAPSVKPPAKSQVRQFKHNSNKAVTPSSKPVRSSPVTLVASSKPSVGSHKCEQCGGTHTLSTCPKFKELSIDDRYVLVSGHRLCMVCFSDNHWANKCKSSCSICHGRHNNLLHRDNSHAKTSSSKQPAVSLVSSQRSRSVLLGTASVKVRDMAGCLQSVRALIDPASQISIMTSDCAKRLGLHRERWTVPVAGLAGQVVQSVDGRVQLTIQSATSQSSLELPAWTLPTITSTMPSIQLPIAVRDRCSHLLLADPNFDSPAPIELLLGADVFPQVLRHKRQGLGPGLPTAFDTIFGWIILGPIDEQFFSVPPQSFVTSLFATSIESMMGRFWEVEEPDEAPSTFTDEGMCEEIFAKESYRNEFGRFVVPLPFRVSPPPTFQDCRRMAVHRFERLERKLTQDQPLYLAYKQFMKEYETLGHMSLAESPGAYFIPHHAVHKMVGDELKLRVVFDASARPSCGTSLNQALFVGPKLQQDIVDILLRFRCHRFVFTGDICKMYRQILVDPKYRQYQHILWRDSTQEKLREYELNTVTYGVSTAPFLALRVLREIAMVHAERYPKVQAALLSQTYMDDICTGANTLEEAQDLQYDLIHILSQFGLELKKWTSNSPQLMKNIPLEDQAVGPLPFNDDTTLQVQVLGLKWNPAEDTFNYNVSSTKFISSKRSMLSIIARIFDPLGFLSPVIFYAKLQLQSAWQAGLSWDERLPSDMETSWSSFVSELPRLSSIHVPRFIGVVPDCHYDLCGFCDASVKGYAAIVYLRVTDRSGSVSVQLLGGKTKLAPIKSMSIPRLELCAAGLLARWLQRLSNILSSQILVRNVYAWSDSSVVLSWLNNSQVEYKVFVSNRLHKIHQILPSCRWFHVRSKLNPADCASRGLPPSELAQFELYWQGPDFLCQPVGDWSRGGALVPADQLPEVKGFTSCLVETKEEHLEWFSRFSSFNRMLRIIIRLRRFVRACLKGPVSHEFLSYQEYNDALMAVVRCSQSICFKNLMSELSSGRVVSSRLLARLSPFIDNEGVIRVGGRLRHSLLSDRRKFPILLSKSSFLSLLIARHWHSYACHAGPRLVSALICRQFWIIGERQVVRRAISECTRCVRLSAHNPQPIMSDLPDFRVQPCSPFSRVGIDYAGPLFMKETSLRKTRQYKVYISVFVCMSVKAVHLELVSELSTDAFLAAFNRFVARRGLPSSVYSDCGTNFVGASKKLSDLVNNPKVQEQLSSKYVCDWHFNPPSAPHFGGLWEAAVRSTKTLLVRVIGNQVLSFEELSTVLCRIESVLNSRPLTSSSNDPNDLECLTPGHFLIGRPLCAVPEAEVPDNSSGLKNRWKLLQQLSQAFWRRWSNEYLNTLQIKARWVKGQENVKLGDLVVIKDNISSPLVWKLGRIQELLPGSDGVVRVVKLLTNQGLITRPVVKIVPLPTQ